MTCLWNVTLNDLKNLGNMFDVSSVIGNPIKTDDGNLIFPIAKITVGELSGGGEYGRINIFKKSSDLPFSAGNGAIVSVKPCGFLIKNNSDYKIISVSENSYEKIIEKATDFLEKINIKDDLL